jgi:hypothetical protein
MEEKPCKHIKEFKDRREDVSAKWHCEYRPPAEAPDDHHLCPMQSGRDCLFMDSMSTLGGHLT